MSAPVDRARNIWQIACAFAVRNRLLIGAALLALPIAVAGLTWWGRTAATRASTPGAIARLEADVAELRETLDARVEADTALRAIEARDGEILLGLRTGLLRDITRWASRAYLNDVRLHIEPGVTVEETGEVRPNVGPFRVRAGEWRLRVTIQRVNAVLSLDSIALGTADSTRLGVRLAIGVSEATGDADVDFEWDASTVGSVVCRDFAVHEPFGGVVPPFTYTVDGAFAFEAFPAGVMIVPQFDRPRLRVRPQATADSWERVQALLDEQNNVFRCGLALQPDDMIEKLARLLSEGFEFQLPEILFRPIRLPARIEDSIELEDRTVAIRNVPTTLVLTQEAIWFGSNIDVGDFDRGEQDGGAVDRERTGR
jgi:hypothetical protein